MTTPRSTSPTRRRRRHRSAAPSSPPASPSEAALDELPREELSARLRSALDEEKEQRLQRTVTDRLLHELQVHQLELEMQNRELRESQVALEESRRRYADLYDFAPIAYFTLDPNGMVTEVNLAGAAIVGRERSRVLGCPFNALVAADDPGEFWRHLRRSAEERSTIVGELAFSTPLGRVEAQMVSAPVLDPAGAVVGFRTAVIDVSRRNEALRERQAALKQERALRAQLDELDRAHAALVAALASTGPATTAVLRIIVERARTLVGAEYAALGLTKGPGEPFAPFLYDGVDEGLLKALGRTPRAVGVFAVVIREGRTVRMKDLRESPEHLGFPVGHPRMTSFLGLPISLGDHTLGSLYVANKHDADEFTPDDQRALERFAGRAAVACEVARLQQETRNAVQMRELTLAVVSHDLSNPVASILLGCEALTHDAPEPDRRRARPRIESIKRSAGHMKRLIEDLLTAVTLESGKLSMQTEPTPLRDVVGEAVEMVQPKAAAKSLRLDVAVPDGLPVVRCDRARIIQVLCNLVANAIKFSPEGNAVQIEACPKDGEIVVSVTDAGSGIAPEHLEHVFERYWKGPPRKGGGTGLGLFISRGIVEAHGGRIWARSEVGRGSTFSFTIPCAGK